MYKVSDYVVYGANGVCRILDICPSPFDKTDTRLFYVMKPLSAVGDATIYIPETFTSRIRPVITPDEAEKVLVSYADATPLDVAVERQRREVYQAAITEGSPFTCLRILKTVNKRRADAAQNKKHLPDVDVEFEAKARKCLLGELSLVLSLSDSEIEKTLFPAPL